MDANLALLVGNVAGALQRLGDEYDMPTKVEPLLDKDGNYTNQIRVTRSSGSYLITIDFQSMGQRNRKRKT